MVASNLGTQFGFYCLQQYLGVIDGLDCSYSRVFNGKFIAYKRIDLMQSYTTIVMVLASLNLLLTA